MEELLKLGFKPIQDDEDEIFEMDLPDGTVQVYQDDLSKPGSWYISSGAYYFSGPFTLPEAIDVLKEHFL